MTNKIIIKYKKNQSNNNRLKVNKDSNLKNNLININNVTSTIKLNGFDRKKDISTFLSKKKANVFDLHNKKKQNKNLIKIISNNSNKSLNNTNLLLNSKTIANIKSIFANIKSISLKSLLINFKRLNFEKEVNNEIIQNKNLESINLNQNIKIEEKKTKNNEKFNVFNEINKKKLSILLFIKNSKNKINKNQLNLKNKNLIKDNKLNFQKKIRKYINSKITFNSKIIKYLSTNNNYNFIKYNKLNNSIKNNINELLRISFFSMSSLISKPIYILKSDKIIINLFYLIFNTDILKNNNTKSVLILENNEKLRIICNYLSYFFKKPIELNLIRLYYPYYNSNILVNFFGIVSNKIKLRKIINSFLSKAIKNNVLNNININKDFLPSNVAGIKIKIAGRLLTQRIVPRKTVKLFNNGALSRNKIMYIETARYTNKNKRGAFSISISLGH